MARGMSVGKHEFLFEYCEPVRPVVITDLYEDVESVTIINRQKTTLDTVSGNITRAIALRETIMNNDNAD